MLWAWTFLLLVPAAGLLAARQLPPWQAMCCLTVATLAGCKAATWAMVDARQASPLRRAGYWLACRGWTRPGFSLRHASASRGRGAKSGFKGRR
jgi:hypothetical protein